MNMERELFIRQRYAHWGTPLILVPLILGLLFVMSRRNCNDMRAAATQICAEPPPCPGDQMEIAHAWGRSAGGHKHGRGLVLYRRSSDCSRDVEVYFSDDGSFQFRGSADDPDVAARVEFIEARKQWNAGHRFMSREPCERADKLWP
jgi:hypothetical protein